MANRLRKSTPYSSTVCVATVATRQFATSNSERGDSASAVLLPAGVVFVTGVKTPSTVLVLPTSRTRSIEIAHVRTGLRPVQAAALYAAAAAHAVKDPPPQHFSFSARSHCPTEYGTQALCCSNLQEPAFVKAFRHTLEAHVFFDLD